MEKTVSKFTVFFEEPFWVGIYERQIGGRYDVCKVVFGSEPKNYDVAGFMKRNQYSLKFSPTIEGQSLSEHKVNPKKMQREISKSMQQRGISTKAQQAISLAREQNKIERRKCSKEEKEADKERKRLIHQEKKRQKHRGH